MNSSAPSTSNGSGSSWSDAAFELRDVLPATPGTRVLVAEGLYLPTSGSDESATFEVTDGVHLLGGYLGTEAIDEEPLGSANKTILSGRVTGIAGRKENSDHVVTITGLGPSSFSILIDGFVIRDGFADDVNAVGGARGGGIFMPGEIATDEVILQDLVVRNCNANDYGGGLAGRALLRLRLNNCVFRDNNAGRRFNGAFTGAGGGIHLETIAQEEQDIALGNVRFVGNQAPDGGAISIAMIFEGSVSLFNCLMHDNAAYQTGGGLYLLADGESGVSTGELFVSHSTISDNDGGGIHLDDADGDLSNNASTTIASSISWGNRLMGAPAGSSEDLFGAATVSSALTLDYSNVGGASAFTGVGNIDVDPLFMNATNDNYRLQAGSACIDAASDLPIEPATLGDVADMDQDDVTNEDVQIDLDGEPRERNVGPVGGTGLPAAATSGISDMGCFEKHIATASGPPQ